VYGMPSAARDGALVTEETPCVPMSPYGETKLAGEWLTRATGRAYGLSTASLRYFNVAGAATPELADTGVFNIVPMVFEKLTEGAAPRIFGDDYPTPDGTCVRDYIHVADLALSHVAAASRLDAGEPIEAVYNLGSGAGVSVGEIMSTVAAVTGIDFSSEIGRRRAGDPARIVASGERAARDLGWLMRHTLEDMVRSAWDARQAAS
jgi:UDP-glucose 4-epimerase